jgi:DNA-directed RNA polymerase sigma subunit (sigma70/sigma32)
MSIIVQRLRLVGERFRIAKVRDQISIGIERSLDKMTPQVETTQVGDRAVHNLKLALLKEAVKGFLERARHVVVRGHGLNGLAEAALPELAEELNIFKGRGRLLQRKAEKMLRTARHGSFLRGCAA